jgi:hypothetical protein
LLPKYDGPIDENDPRGFFASHEFSEPFFENEWKNTAEKWHDCVEKLSPKIYNSVIAEIYGLNKVELDDCFEL